MAISGRFGRVFSSLYAKGDWKLCILFEKKWQTPVRPVREWSAAGMHLASISQPGYALLPKAPEGFGGSNLGRTSLGEDPHANAR